MKKFPKTMSHSVTLLSLLPCFDKLLHCHTVYSWKGLNSFFTKILCWQWESRAKTNSCTSQGLSMGLRSGLCDGQSMCENDFFCSWSTLSQFKSWPYHFGVYIRWPDVLFYLEMPAFLSFGSNSGLSYDHLHPAATSLTAVCRAALLFFLFNAVTARWVTSCSCCDTLK